MTAPDTTKDQQPSLPFDPHTNWALAVVDMQNDFLHGDGYYARREHEHAPGAGAGMRSATLPTVVSKVCQAVGTAREWGRPVAFVRAVYDRRFSVIPPGLRRDPGRVDYPCRPNTWGAEFVEPIAAVVDAAPADAKQAVIDKHTYDAFHDTQLHEFLQAAKVTHLVVCGTETQVCVMATAAHATFLGYLCYIVEDAVWAMNQETANATLEIFRDAYGDTLTAAQLAS